MNRTKSNIFLLPDSLPSNEEIFEPIITSNRIHIERIISTGQKTPEDKWYDQEKDEWVILLQGHAVISYEDGQKVIMERGDYIFIPAHDKHRVEETSINPACIWLAIHADMK